MGVIKFLRRNMAFLSGGGGGGRTGTGEKLYIIDHNCKREVLLRYHKVKLFLSEKVIEWGIYYKL